MNIKKIHNDKRGEIYSLDGLKNYPEVAILVTKKGYARGGCVHKDDEYFVIIEGNARYQIGNDIESFATGMSGFIPAKSPHCFVAQTDCIIMEWGVMNKENESKDPEMRKKVNEINDRNG